MTDPSAVNRDLSLLAPKFRAKVEQAVQACKSAGGDLDVMVFEGYRSTERQAWLYAQGRTRPGNIVTNARSSLTSWHGYGLAVDIVHRTKFWKPCGDDAAANERWFASVAAIFKANDCNWGGDWTRPDTPHMQWGRCAASPGAGAQELFKTGGIGAVWSELSAS